jgi:hypothetical protein
MILREDEGQLFAGMQAYWAYCVTIKGMSKKEADLATIKKCKELFEVTETV